MSTLYTWAVREDLAPVNPCRGVERPLTESSIDFLSREEVPPVLQFRGTPRLEYTIGVSGCGQKGTYLVICPEDGSGCFAGAGRRE